MSREVVGTAVPDVAVGPRRHARDDAAPRDEPRPAPARPHAPVPAPVARPRLRARFVVAVLATGLLAGAAGGWQGAGAWRQAQEREVALASTTATAAAVGVEDAGSGDTGRTASLVVRVTNLGGVPLQVFTGGASFTAVRIRFLEPSDATVAPRGRLDVRVAVEVDCASPQTLAVPPLRVGLPDDASRDVPVEAAAPALATLCGDGTAGAVPLVSGVAVRARTDVAVLLDGPRFRLSLVAPSGRTTRIVAVRAGSLDLSADPLPMTVDGTARAMWLDPPDRCPAAVRRQLAATGVPRSVDVDVDPGSGQTATVRVEVGDTLAAWLLRGACGRDGTDGTAGGPA